MSECKDCQADLFHRIWCPVLYADAIGALGGLAVFTVIAIIYWSVKGGSAQSYTTYGIFAVIGLGTTFPILLARRRRRRE